MKNILVTGASRGIGRAIAVEFAQSGNRIILSGRNKAKLEETGKIAESKGAKVQCITADLSIPENVLKLIQEVDVNSLDVLVNNAGIAIVEAIADMQLKSWQKTFDVNVTAPFLLIQGLCSKMSKGSSIVNISSIAAKQGFQSWSTYCMSKHALEGFTKSIRDELSALGIRIISLYPGAVSTDIWTSVPGEQDLDKMMKPEAIASMVHVAVNQPEGTVVEEIVMRNLIDM